MSKNIYVAPSSIEGNGVFSKKKFKKGQTVFLFKGNVYHRVNKGKKDTYANPNSIGFGKNLWIDPTGNFPFINHSCNPNTGIKGKVTFTALRNIKKGDEITFDYSIIEEDTQWEMKNLEPKSTPGFRPVIQSIQHLPLVTYKKHLPLIPKYFQKVYVGHHKLNVKKK